MSKSTFLRGVQCEKSLYLYKNLIHLRDKISPERQAIFSRGHDVGFLARDLFPGGVDASLPNRNDHVASLEKTAMLVSSGAPVIYEAAFVHNRVLVLLDILVKDGDQWKAYEVKSSVRITHTYVLDASLQYWVMNGAGLPISDFHLVTMNSQYVRQGPLDVQSLFSNRSVMKDILRKQEAIALQVAAAAAVAEDPRMPDKPIGEHCFSPYPCDFMGTCWKHVPADSVFDIGGIPKSEQFGLFNSGIKRMEDVPAVNQLNKQANLHLDAVRSGRPLTNPEALRNWLGQLQYPVRFLDFEIFMPAVPLFEGTRPYQHLPFQFSMHRLDSPVSEPHHSEFLAEPGYDPRETFLRSLLAEAGTEGSILVYDALLERSILNGLKELYPEHYAGIENILSRIVDLMVPFQEKWYYDAAMKNSFSIKNVLPAMVPDLSFSGLKISSGSIAMAAFESLQKETDLLRIIETRENLLAYCKMDTYAMVRVFAVLNAHTR